MEWSRWYLVQAKDKITIRRYRKHDGKTQWERLPKAKYEGLPLPEVEALLRRLNATHEIKRRETESRYDFDHAYINVQSLAKFEEYLSNKATDRGHINATMQVLKEYATEFFVIKEKLPDPNEWHRKETEWGTWLLKQKLSVSTMKRVISTANRFNQFLCTRMYPEMKNPRKLEPIGRNKFKRLQGNEDKTKGYITQDQFKEICKHAKETEPDVLPNIILCYKLGLRLSETLGLTKEKFFTKHVVIDEQGASVAGGAINRKVVKTDSRKVPYWRISGKEAWDLVKKIKPMHPDTLNEKVNGVLTKFNLTSHDFRRTFITDALEAFHWREVQDAVGHKDVRTTMSYARDKRGLDDERLDLD